MDNEKKLNQDENPIEEKKEKSSSKRGMLSKTSIPSFVFLLLGISFVLIYCIVNISSLARFFVDIFNVILPILLGASIAFLLNPILKFFEFTVFKKLKSKKLNRTLSIFLTYIAALLFIGALLWLIIPSLIESIGKLANEYDNYIKSATDIINNLLVKITSRPELAEYIDEAAIKSAIMNFFNASGNIIDLAAKYIVDIGGALFVGVKNVILAFFISIYFLASKDRLRAQIKKFTTAFFSGTTNKRIKKYSYLTNNTFGSYFVGLFIDAIIVGILTFVGMTIFNIEYAPLISVIIAITNIIPVFGPFIGGIPSFFIVFISDPRKAIIFAILILVIQQIDGNIIVPKIHGNSTGLSSLGVIVSITVMGAYFGFVGMIIGVPIFALIVTLVKEFVEHRLKLKGLPTDTAVYYEKDSLEDPHPANHQNPWGRFFKKISTSVSSFFAGIFKKKSK